MITKAIREDLQNAPYWSCIYTEKSDTLFLPTHSGYISLVHLLSLTEPPWLGVFNSTNKKILIVSNFN